MNRITNVSNHINTSPVSSKVKSHDDVVVCSALRTPLCKSKKGNFRNTCVEDMMAPLMKATIDRTSILPELIGDIQMGNVLQSGAGFMPARMAALMAGIPETVPVIAINRQCSSGLQAVANVAAAIKAGYIDAGLAGGVESMSSYSMMSVIDPDKVPESVLEHERARNCLISMGMTSENVAEKFGISREKQDIMAVESHMKAVEAQEKGLFNDEIVSVVTTVQDPKTRLKRTITVSKDEGCRAGLTLESLSKLPPAFKKGGSTTAGNSSQVSDGAAVVLLARRSVAEKRGLPIIGRMVSFAAVGVPPEIMGIGPAVAIPAALEQAGLTIDDIDVFEVNEAFASQATYCMEKLKIPKHKLNPKGGAIALGHPLGCTGARQIATLFPELRRTKGRFGVVSMCIGGGMGAAGVFESEQ